MAEQHQGARNARVSGSLGDSDAAVVTRPCRDHRDRLLGAVGDDDLVGRGGDAAAGQRLAQRQAQLLESRRAGVFVETARIGRERFLGELLEQAVGNSARTGHAAGKIDRAGRALDRHQLAQAARKALAEAANRAGKVGARLRRRGQRGFAGRGDKGAAADFGADQAGLFELLKSLDRGELVDAEILGDVDRGREAIAGLQFTSLDRAAHGFFDPAIEGRGAVGFQFELERHSSDIYYSIYYSQ